MTISNIILINQYQNNSQQVDLDFRERDGTDNVTFQVYII